MPKDWVISPPADCRDDLARALRVSPVVGQVLANRGVHEVEAARQFLRPQIADMLGPDQFPATLRAAERICGAIEAGRRIVIFGDYDVDGVTGVSILWHVLRLAGAEPGFYIPHRLEEGYGISPEAVKSLADEGASLIVTVDCGVTAIEAAALAKSRGVELIITDHHNPRTNDAGRMELPEALLVHPAIPGENDSPYSNPHLCGAGVALKLAWAVAQKASRSTKVMPAYREFLLDAMGLAALGTVADIVPLVGENRIIAHHGLASLPHSRLAGVQALIESVGLRGKQLAGFDVGFKLGPRLNAIGRMGHARLAVEMLTRASAAEAAAIAANLEQHNRARQALERRITGEARDMIAAQGLDREPNRAIVLASGGWHAGIIGIVAGRLAESYGRPTVLIALEDGVGQGSARSVRNFPLHEVFRDCQGHLIGFGGHAMAAGLRIEGAKVDAFREAFCRRAGQMLTPQDLRTRLRVDDVVELGQLNEQLVADLDRLEPFGAGNPEPMLATADLDLVGDARAVGAGGQHLQVTLSDGRTRCKGIAFGQAGMRDELLDRRRCQVAFRPIINEWNGRRSVEMQIADFRCPG